MTSSAPKSPTGTTLILTATVDPQPVPVLVQREPETRATEYVAALRRWTRHSSLFNEIIWWENSGHVLAHKIASEFAPVVTAHISRAEEFDSRLGKGYGEALMLEQIANVGIGSTYMLKCTGRLSVVNIGSLVSILDSAPDVVVRLSQDFTFADSRLFVVSSALLPELTADLKHEVNDDRGAYLEHALARRVLRLAYQGAKIRFWPAPPQFRGRSGSTGKVYDSFRSRVRWPLESAFYRIKRLGTFL